MNMLALAILIGLPGSSDQSSLSFSRPTADHDNWCTDTLETQTTLHYNTGTEKCLCRCQTDDIIPLEALR